MPSLHDRLTDRYVVICDDGLEMWAPMDRDTAEALAANPTASGKRQYAVPANVARVISAARKDLGAAAERKLAADRLAKTRQLLAAYDSTRHLVA
jgi:hypothetical protein